MTSVLKQILLYLCLFLGVATLKAQHVEYGVALDTNYMMIGDQQHLTFKAKVDPGVRIVFPRLQDTVVHGLEIISGPVRDSVKEKDGRWLLEEKYVVTAFDTGVYVVPPQPITIESQEYNNIVRTDPVGLVVNTFQEIRKRGITISLCRTLDFCRDFALSVVGFVRDCPYSDLLAVLGPEAEEQTLVYAEERRDSALCHGYPFLG